MTVYLEKYSRNERTKELKEFRVSKFKGYQRGFNEEEILVDLCKKAEDKKK